MRTKYILTQACDTGQHGRCQEIVTGRTAFGMIEWRCACACDHRARRHEAALAAFRKARRENGLEV